MNDKASTKNTGGSAAPAASAPGDVPSALEAAPPKGWVEAVSDRLVYKPDACHSKAIQGILMARVELPEGPNGDPWFAYIVRCTQPTLGVDREDKVHEVPAGAEILLPETFRLADLKKAAENLAIAWEVWIKPKNQVPLGQGKKMWVYTIAVNPNSKKRTADQAFFLGNNTTGPNHQLGNGAAGQGVGADAPDAPFG